MKLADIMQKVKEENLPKSELEHYHTLLTDLLAKVTLEKAELQKKEAFFKDASELESAVAKKLKWDVTAEGQRLITLKGYIDAIKPLIASVKSRLYAF